MASLAFSLATVDDDSVFSFSFSFDDDDEDDEVNKSFKM
jgi:hypothetical protein